VIVSAGANCLGDASVDDGSFDPNNDSLTVSQSPPGPYPAGTNLVTLTVTDSHGASSLCQARVIVRDVSPPMIQCPTAINVTNRHDAWNSIVSFNPSFVDNCSESARFVCTPASGSVFGLGTNIVTCIASDAAGNSSQCQFNVTVLPGNQAPVPVIQTIPSLIDFPGSTNKVIIASASVATVVFDGSSSYDPDDALFSFSWLENGILLSSEEAASVKLTPGEHKITLAVDDGFPLGTNSASIEFEVISPATAVGLLSDLLKISNWPEQAKQSLDSSLSGAAASFLRGHERAGINQLGAFQLKLSARPRQFDSDFRDRLIQGAQLIIDAVRPNGP
jgi:hypothetical protein